MEKCLLIETYFKYRQRYTLTTTQIWRMHWNTTGNEMFYSQESIYAYHSQESIYAYQWDLGSNAKLLYLYEAFHYEGKCETFMVKTTPVTHFPSPLNGPHISNIKYVRERRKIVLQEKNLKKIKKITHCSNHTNDKIWKSNCYRINYI